jgi:hypothetical protein
MEVFSAPLKITLPLSAAIIVDTKELALALVVGLAKQD